MKRREYEVDVRSAVSPVIVLLHRLMKIYEYNECSDEEVIIVLASFYFISTYISFCTD